MASDPNSIPDPFGPNPVQASTDGDGTQDSAADGSSLSPINPFLSNPFESSTLIDAASSSPDDLTPPMTPLPSSGATLPQAGTWFSDPDPQFLIQWSLEEVQGLQTATSSFQAEPPTGYQARVRVFQEVFETTLAAARPIAPFSLRDAIDPYPYLQGSLVLLQQPAGTPPVLLVKNLKFSGFQQSQVVLFPLVPDTPAGASGALSGAPGGSGD